VAQWRSATSGSEACAVEEAAASEAKGWHPGGDFLPIRVHGDGRGAENCGERDRRRALWWRPRRTRKGSPRGDGQRRREIEQGSEGGRRHCAPKWICGKGGKNRKGRRKKLRRKKKEKEGKIE
jgi:hypothetical protein